MLTARVGLRSYVADCAGMEETLYGVFFVFDTPVMIVVSTGDGFRGLVCVL